MMLYLLLWATRASVVFAIAAIAARIARRAPAATRHTIWVAAISAALIMPLATISLPRFSIAPAPQNQRARILLAPLVNPAALVAASSPAIQETAPQRQLTRVTSSPLQHEQSGIDLSLFALLVWAAGAVALLLKLAFDVLGARRLVASARVVDTTDSLALIREFAGQLAANRILVVESAAVEEPMTAGLVNAVVVLPLSHTEWTTAERRAIMAHEIAHALRRDCLAQFVGRVTRSLHWFNPLAWYAARAMRDEAERACDDRVLVSGANSLAYAELLVAFVRRTHRNRPASFGLPMASRGAELERRLNAIVNQAGTRRVSSAWERTAVVVASTLVLVFAASAGLDAAQPVVDTIPAIARVVAPVPAPKTTPIAAGVPGPGSSTNRTLNHKSQTPYPDSSSERLPLTETTIRLARSATATLHGPDSALAHALFNATEHLPTHDGDLVAERATWALAHARGDRLVDPLIDALSSRDWRESAYAAWALGGVNDARVLQPLLALLAHPIWRARAMASATLASIADPRAATGMTVALVDTEWQVRVEAVKYFGKLGDAASLGAVRAALKDAHIAVRSEAQGALSANRRPR